MQLFSLVNSVVKSEIDLTPIGIRRHKSTGSTKFDFTIEVNGSSCLNRTFQNNETQLDVDYGYYFKSNMALFEFIEGNTISVTPFCNVHDLDFIRVLLNYPLASIMYQKGFFNLHACAVKVQDKVFLFAGSTQKGKSTLAAYIVKRGGKLISEDTCIMKLTSKGVYVYPSYPMIKISDDANKFINFDKSCGINLPSDASRRKGYFVGAESFCSEPQKVNVCIFPDWCDDEVSLTRLTLRNSLSRIMEASLSIYPLTRLKELRLLRENVRFLSQVSAFSYSRERSFLSLMDGYESLFSL